MTGLPELPRAARPFVEFPVLLRAHGFAVAPEQTTAFLTAIELLGPKGMGDIRQAAHATLAPPVERHEEFDALFAWFFMGQTVAAAAGAEDDGEEMRVQEQAGGVVEPELGDDEHETGQAATTTEALSQRQFAADDDAIRLRRFARDVPNRMPVRRGYRNRPARGGPNIDFRKTLREAVRNDGEMLDLPRLRRGMRQRRILLLIDVSGSMKAQTDSHLRFAHALARAADAIEVFTLGTRLTRITPALRLRNRDQALEAAAQVVSDWDGGTRIGDALQAFLAVPRFAGYARGAAVLVVSDGLERGDHAGMVDAVRKLSRLAWRLNWLSPLASGERFEPRTAALRDIAPFVDEIADASSLDRLCSHVLNLSRERAA